LANVALESVSELCVAIVSVWEGIEYGRVVWCLMCECLFS
jgi:hypothetical protein